MRLAVVSDLHLTLDTAQRASWHNPFDFSGVPARIDAARAAFDRAGVDAVVCCGDVTHDGDEGSARAALERLSARLEPPLLIVAGNHDCLERDDLLEDVLSADGVELGGVRVAGVAIERHPEEMFRWTGAGDYAGAGVVVSHFPVLSRAERLAEHGLAYPGDLTNRSALHQRVLGEHPVVVLSGHIHARDSHARDGVLQLSAGALVEAPYEIAIVDVRVDGTEVRVRRRVQELGGPAVAGAPVLAPADETWWFDAGGWRCAA